MTNALLAIAIVVVAGIVVVGIVRGTTPSPAASSLANGNNDQWLAAARSAVNDGQDIARRLRVVSTADAVPMYADAIDELDRLTTQVAELSATAPTAMDTRVCRNLAVRCQALSDALRSLPYDDSSSLRREGQDTLPLRDHRTEFETAVRDLAEHVNLV